MDHFEETWTARDGLMLFAQGWEPQGEPHGVVCLVHGLGEHSGRYAHVGAYLAEAGYALLAFDLRGYGKSAGQRGHVDDYHQFFADIDLLLEKARLRYHGKPCFLYGHSLGSLLVLTYLSQRQPDIAGVVVTGAVLRNAIAEQKGKILFARTMNALFPKLSISSGLDASQISHDPEVVRAYVQDPLVHDKVTLRTGVTLLDLFAAIHQPGFQLPTVPLLMMHGAEDAITYPAGTSEFAGRVGGDVTVKFWDGMRHEIHNEPGKEQVLAYMVGWLNKQLEDIGG